MKPKEVAKLVGIAVGAYPYMQEKDNGAVTEVWCKLLADLDYPDAEAALVSHISSNRFFPTVADIREGAAKLKGSVSMMTADEAWKLVSKAIRNGAYGSDAEFRALPPEVQVVVGSPRDLKEMGLMDSGDLGNERARFRMAWEARAQRSQYLAVMPAEVRGRLEAVSEKLRLGDGRK